MFTFILQDRAAAPAPAALRGAAASRCCARAEVAVAGSTALLRGKSNCLVLKGDLNLCMKGSRVFALDFILAFYFYFLAFYFGFAFSPSFQPILFFPLSRSSHEPVPAAPAPVPRAGQPPRGCAPCLAPGSCSCFLPACVLTSDTFKECFASSIFYCISCSIKAICLSAFSGLISLIFSISVAVIASFEILYTFPLFVSSYNCWGFMID